MIGAHKLIVVTPAGRRRFLDILRKHVLACKAVDEWHLWANTSDIGDREWMIEAEVTEPRIKIKWPEWELPHIHRYFAFCNDPNAVYVRLDDDIVWAAPDAIERLAKERLADFEPFVVFGNIVNNALTSVIQQRAGRLTREYGACEYDCMDSVGWGSGPFAVDLHKRFLACPRSFWWQIGPMTLGDFERCSVNAISFLGSESAEWGRKVAVEEEVWLSETMPRLTNRPCRIVGAAVFVHYAFRTQLAAVDAHPEIIEGYRSLAPT